MPAFIAHPRYLADQAAPAPANPWSGGDNEMKARVPGWNGRPVWGRERTTWLKFVALPAPAAGTGPTPATVKSDSPDDKPALAPPGPAASTADKPEAGATAAPAGKPKAGATAAPAPAVSLTKRATFTGHPALVYCVAVSPDGSKVVSGTRLNSISAATGWTTRRSSSGTSRIRGKLGA